MKHYIAAALLTMLISGCSLFSSSKYEPTEYVGFINLLTQTEVLNEACDTGTRKQLLSGGMRAEYIAHNLQNYTAYRPNNKDTMEIVKIIRQNINEFIERYKTTEPSTVYCKSKTQILINQSKAGAEVVQKKVRQ